MVRQFSRKVVNMWKTSSAAYLTPPAPGQPDAWTTGTRGRGGQRIAAAGRSGSTAEIAAALRIEDGDPVIHRSRIILMDDEPVEIVTSYYPASLAGAEALAEPSPIKGGAVRLLADLGWTASTVVEDVSAETTEYLVHPGAPKDQALLVIRRTAYASSGVPFEYTVMVSWDGRRQRYALELA
jgi:GntR family transcriptional regulator